MKKMRVYYSTSSEKIESGEAVSINRRENRVNFSDGGWNHLEETFLTARQARRAASLPEPPSAAIIRAAKSAAAHCEGAAQRLRDALEREKTKK